MRKFQYTKFDSIIKLHLNIYAVSKAWMWFHSGWRPDCSPDIKTLYIFRLPPVLQPCPLTCSAFSSFWKHYFLFLQCLSLLPPQLNALNITLSLTLSSKLIAPSSRHRQHFCNTFIKPCFCFLFCCLAWFFCCCCFALVLLFFYVQLPYTTFFSSKELSTGLGKEMSSGQYLLNEFMFKDKSWVKVCSATGYFLEKPCTSKSVYVFCRAWAQHLRWMKN